MKSHILISFSYLSWKINCGHHCYLHITHKPTHNRDDLKIEEFPSSFPSLSLKVDGMKKERMTSNGLQCEVGVVHFKWIKGESGWIKSKVC